MTVAADPLLLRRIPASTDALADRVVRAAGEVGDALDHVRATCVDHAPTVGPIDHELRTLSARWREAGSAAVRFADDLQSADSGGSLRDLLGASRSLVNRIVEEPEIIDRLLDLLDGDATPDEIDAALDALRDIGGRVGDAGAVHTFVLDVGLLLASGTMPASSLAQWAVRARLRGLGRWASVGQAYAVGDDLIGLWDAFANDRSGEDKVIAVGRSAFDVSSIACTTRPSVPTCGAAVVTGLVWGGAEAYKRREGLRQAYRAGRERAEDFLGDARRLAADLVDGDSRSVYPHPLVPPGLLPLVEPVGRAVASGLTTGRGIVAVGTELAGDSLRRGSRALERGGETVKDGAKAVRKGVEGRARALKDGAEDIGDFIVDGVKRYSPL